jgi:hypothetical protein
MTGFPGETRLRSDHHQEEQYRPPIEIGYTSALFDHIPIQGPWQLPKPWHGVEKVDTKSFRETWDELFTEWIRYLDHASKGFQIIQRTITEGVISFDLASIQAANYFHNSGLEGQGYEKKIEKVLSVRRAFATLMSKDAQDKSGMKGEDILVSDEDIQNARKLVHNFKYNDSYFSNLTLDAVDI